MLELILLLNTLGCNLLPSLCKEGCCYNQLVMYNSYQLVNITGYEV